MNIHVKKTIINYLKEQSLVYDETTQGKMNKLLSKNKKLDNDETTFIYTKGTIDKIKKLFSIKNTAFFFSSYVPNKDLYSQANQGGLRFRDKIAQGLDPDSVEQINLASEKRKLFLNFLDGAEEYKINYQQQLKNLDLFNITTKNNPEEAAEKLRIAFEHYKKTIKSLEKAELFYEHLVYFLEQLGVLIFMIDRQKATGMTGAYINRPMYPVILVKDSYTYKRNNFTVLHEFAHLLLSNKDEANYTTNCNDINLFGVDGNDEEVWANKFAGAFLIPSGSEILEQNFTAISSIEKGATSTSFSKYVLLFRLYRFKKISKEQKNEFYNKMIDKDKQSKDATKKSSNGGPPRGKNLMIHQAGIYASQQALYLLGEQKISRSALFSFLGAKPSSSLSFFYSYYREVNFK